jgi:hypothetical protein
MKRGVGHRIRTPKIWLLMLYKELQIVQKSKTRDQRGFQNIVALAGQFSNRFVYDLRRLANLAI